MFDKLTHRYFDGQQLTPKDVTVNISGDDLMIRDASSTEVYAIWRLSRLRLVDRVSSDKSIIARASSELSEDTGERLYVSKDGLPRHIWNDLHPVTGLDFRGLSVPLLIGGGLLAGLAAFVWMIPAMIVAAAPPSMERELGDYIHGSLQVEFGEHCTETAGRVAFDIMNMRLLSHYTGEITPKIYISDSLQVNAVALPGGHIIVYRGLLEKLESPEVLAGIIGHEVGHVSHRHALRAIASEVSLWLVLGFMSGDMGFIGDIAVSSYSASFSRDQERAADDYAADLLSQASISSSALSQTFADGLSGEGGDWWTYLSSHPSDEERAAFFMDRDTTGGGRVLLSNEQWTQLKDICSVTKPWLESVV